MLRSLVLLALAGSLSGVGIASAQTAVGDTLFTFNAGQITPTQDTGLSGIVFADGHHWVTSFNPPTYDHQLYKIAPDGSEVVESYSLGTGYHAYYDLAYDGAFLYVTDRDHLAQIDPATGAFTGVQIPADFGVYLVAGVAYDPATDHFWVVPQRNGQLQVIHEIDRAGTVLRTFPNLDTDYTAALTWDTWSPGGPFLWTFSREEVGLGSRGVLRQFSPAVGAFTGVEIEMVNRSPFVEDSPLGCALTDALDDDTVTMITLQAGALQVTDGLDWVVVYDADLRDGPPLGPQITVSPTAIEVDAPQDETIRVPVAIGNTGTVDLTWDAYAGNVDAALSPIGGLGDVQAVVDVTGAIGDEGVFVNGMTAARGHLWVSGHAGPGNDRLYKITLDGALVDSYPIGGLSSLGWRSLTSDGDFIYGTDTYSIPVWSIDSTRVVSQVITGSISPNALAYDPDNEHFYLGSGTGAIEVLDREGDTVRFLITPYDLEGLAWDDLSPDGPFLWAWVDLPSGAGSCCEAVQLDPATGLATGVRFLATDQGTLPSQPEAAALTRDVEAGTLSLLGLQESEDYTGYEAFVVGYDLAVAPPPAWLDLEGATVGRVAPGATDTLTVAIHGAASDTTLAAVLRIGSNDLDQPLVEVPITLVVADRQPDDDGMVPGPGRAVVAAHYPNPFTPPTRIRFELQEAADVTLAIYDIRGRRIVQMEQAFAPGSHAFVWDGATDGGRPAASGVYVYTLRIGDAVTTRKVVLVR